ncbi:unnamed protein product [Caenorhabditis auriculariae]|uniref:Guanylate kinase-like domain-containing protein n=1 Tax=Caenorhabditis auriculariae TaxID=2777116 RepID=A0A8S1HI01_9PELO|nr:unnamed protein product [Caenorhabditis auriculariae]
MNGEDELGQLRSNADNLARCLHVLLEKIEKIEQRQNGTPPAIHRHEEPEKYEQVQLEDRVEVDEKTGVKKRTIVTERVLTTKTFHALAVDGPSPSLAPLHQASILEPVYQARVVNIDAAHLAQVEVETISQKLVVTRVSPYAKHEIQPGDVISAVDGKPVNLRGDLENLTGRISLTLTPAAIHQAPSLFYRIQDDYNSVDNGQRLSIAVKKGDVVQVLSFDEAWIQARKMADLSQVGYLPASLSLEKVSMLTPFGRRVLVLLGAVGVGRRTLKSMLLHLAPHYFSTVVPLTSRAQRPGEREGREYHFVRKEEIYQKIREGGMIEWGELDDQLYGTSAESVRSEVRSGRLCVLDCAPQALNYLYNGEFMPFVVHVRPPELEELEQLEMLRRHHRGVDKLSAICRESERIAVSCPSQIHLTLINRNIDVTFKRLLDVLEMMRYETQWVPESWMC